MSNMPDPEKMKVSLQLDNEVIVALDKKAEQDKTSRNAVANYLLSSSLEKIIASFTEEEKARLQEMREKNILRRKNNQKTIPSKPNN